MRYLKEMKEKWTDELDEMSVTGAIDGGSGPPRTPKAFGDEEDENDNAEQSGLKKMKKTKNHTKVVESQSLFKKMMSEMYGINDIEESIGKPSKYQIGTHPVSREDLLIHMIEKEDGDWKMTTPAKDKEAVKALVKKYGMENVAIDGTQRNGDPATYVFVNEAVSYREFKKDPTSSPSQKVNKGIAEVNKMLAEIEKIVHNNLKLKQESGVDSSHFWKSTGKRFLKINERITKISNRLKELSQ